MNITMHRTAAAPKPIIPAPPSKSDAHRLLILAALSESEGPIHIACCGTNADMEATVRCLCALGAKITASDDGCTVIPLDRTALSPTAEYVLYVGESGSTLRFLLPILGALGVCAVIHREGRLPDRPLSPLDATLTARGMTLYDDPTDRTVLRVHGTLQAGEYEIDGSVSSQFISGPLFALPLLDAPSVLRITGTISSAPYIVLTHSALSRFGCPLQPTDEGRTYHIAPTPYRATSSLQVEGDWSGAAFLLCAGAMTDGVTVTGLSPDSIQGDRRILDVLTLAGCHMTWQEKNVSVSVPKDGSLRPINIHADDIPDLVPPIAMLCCAANGISTVTGCSRLRIKESDRLSAILNMITSLGGSACTAETDGDTLTVYGSCSLRGGICDGVGDHRMVMSAALAALIAENAVTVSDREAIGKSYPRFFEDFTGFGICDTEPSR